MLADAAGKQAKLTVCRSQQALSKRGQGSLPLSFGIIFIILHSTRKTTETGYWPSVQTRNDSEKVHFGHSHIKIGVSQ